MKKWVNAILLLVLVASNCVGQIVIDQNDMPVAGSTVLRRTATGINSFNFTNTGANFSWDFSMLTPADTSSVNYFNITQAPLTSLFTFGPLAPNNTKSQLFRNGANPLNFNGVTGANFLFNVDSTFEFYKKGAPRYAKTGYSINLNGFPVPLAFDSNDVIYNFPLNFGDVDSSHSIFEINIPLLSFLYYNGDQRRINTVDGWGKLKLPNVATEYDVLRVRSELFKVDSIHIDTLIINTGFKFNRPKEVEYKWIAKGLNGPILEANATEVGGVETITNVRFLYTPPVIPAAVSNAQIMKEVKLSLQGNQLYFTSKQQKPYQIIISNAQGQLVSEYHKVYSNAFISLDVPAGQYFVQVIDEQRGRAVIKIMKKD